MWRISSPSLLWISSQHTKDSERHWSRVQTRPLRLRWGTFVLFRITRIARPGEHRRIASRWCRKIKRALYAMSIVGFSWSFEGNEKNLSRLCRWKCSANNPGKINLSQNSSVNFPSKLFRMIMYFYGLFNAFDSNKFHSMQTHRWLKNRSLTAATTVHW